MKPLLILVDLQQDYLKSADFEPSLGRALNGAVSLTSLCRTRGIKVAHVWTTVSRERDNRMPHWKRAEIWRCEQGTPGHKPPSILAPLEHEPVIHKSGFSAPGFAEFVRSHAADTVIVAGLKTHACIRQAALDAYQDGLAVWVAADAVMSDDPLHAAITRRYLEARGVEFLSNADVAARLDGDAPNFAVQGGFDHAAAIMAAHDTAKTWRNSSVSERISCIERLAEVLSKETGQFAELMARELGKPVRFGHQEGLASLKMLNSIIGRNKQEGDAGKRLEYVERRRPHGVVAAITPWNNPIYLPLGKLVPAILHGNGVVWKPAPEAQMVSRRLYECCVAANWPQGLVQLIEGGEREAVAVMNHNAVGAVTITGSSLAGYAAQEICARRRVALQAELGGNNGVIVWHDVELAKAARMVAFGAFEMAGQRCTANRRVIVHEGVCDAFLPLLMRKSADLRWGNPLLSETDIGPLVSESRRDCVAAVVERAAEECGPPLLPLGERPSCCSRLDGAFYPPTIMFCDDPKNEIVQEETFGPVLVIQVARDWSHAIRLLNDVRQGLAAAVFTTSRDIVRRFLDEAEAGILKVNQSTAGAAVDAPFGGWKASGIGLPEHGRFDMEFFTRTQAVYGAVDE